MTIYALALAGITSVENYRKKDKDKIINDISNFVENTRLQQSTGQQSNVSVEEEGQPKAVTSSQLSTEELAIKLQEAKDRANQAILEAEQFKAPINEPRGENFVIKDSVGMGASSLVQEPMSRNSLNLWPQNLTTGNLTVMHDDAFFHITCHVDSPMREKITKGECVELEKLLPKNRYKQRRNEGRLERVSKGGYTYLTPMERDNKIMGIHKWEQVFHVYAATYTRANPARSAKIWQYVYVINHAASKFQWDNVAEYDFNFWQLMHYNPKRNWAQTYSQKLLPRNSGNSSGYSQGTGGNNMGSGLGNYNPGTLSATKKKKNDNCWKFNKGTRENKNCKWPHK